MRWLMHCHRSKNKIKYLILRRYSYVYHLYPSSSYLMIINGKNVTMHRKSLWNVFEQKKKKRNRYYVYCITIYIYNRTYFQYRHYCNNNYRFHNRNVVIPIILIILLFSFYHYQHSPCTVLTLNIWMFKKNIHASSSRGRIMVIVLSTSNCFFSFFILRCFYQTYTRDTAKEFFRHVSNFCRLLVEFWLRRLVNKINPNNGSYICLDLLFGQNIFDLIAWFF